MALILPAYSASIFSKYGVIQNVQNYSTNPAYNPDSPYNNRLPAPVYATGPQVGTEDCLRIVSDLIAVTCMNMNNCADAELADVRPTVMLQLSRITTGNYATSCGGYIDGAFNDYVAQYGRSTKQMNVVAFPTPNTNNIQPIQIQNPFAPKVPDWAADMQERKQELQNLQSQNGTNQHGVVATAFPTTYADLSFSERMANEQTGYMPWKDAQAYDTLNIESKEDYMDRRIEEAKQEQELTIIRDFTNLSFDDFCAKWPSDERCEKPEQTTTVTKTKKTEEDDGDDGNNNEGKPATKNQKEELIKMITEALRGDD